MLPFPNSLKSLLLAVTLVTGLCFQAATASTVQSEWARLDTAGKLSYKTLAGGDRILDYSYAGYCGGGVKLPNVAVQKTVAPSGGDDSASIQFAVDAVAALPLKDGFRGAVLLAPGIFHCDKPITISQDGIVLRGSGASTNGTVIEMTGTPHTCVSIAGERLKFPKETPTNTFPVTDAYIPSGALSLSVKDAQGLAVGDTVLIRWLRTAKWIHFMGMDTLVRNGQAQTWMKSDSPISFERTIRLVKGNCITLDVPLNDAVDSQFLAPATAVVVKTMRPKRLVNCGLESVQIHSPPPSGTLTAGNNLAASLDNCEDCWITDVSMYDTLGNVFVASGARRITLKGVHATHTATVEKGAGYPSDFTIRGSQVLIDRCSSKGDGSFYVATLGATATLNVVLHCEFQGRGAIQPHMYWSTALLIDSCRLPEGKIDFINRGTSGSGHGWAIGWAVAWNCTAKWFNIQQPPGSMNWCIGGVGELDKKASPKGPWLSSHGTPVEPASLYLAQLRERLGAQALPHIGY